MKFFIIRIMIALGIISFFEGSSDQFEAFAKESSSGSSSSRSDTMGGGRSGGCSR